MTESAPSRTVYSNVRLRDGRSASLAVEAGKFVEVGNVSVSAADRVVDLGGALVIPGLVDGHIHLDKTFVGHGWRPHRPCSAGFDVRERVDLEKQELASAGDVRTRATALIEQIIACGSTHIRCHVDVDPTVRLTNLEALIDLRQQYADVINIQFVAFPQSGILAAPGTDELLDEALRSGADLIGGLDPASFDHDINGHLEIVFGLAERHGAGADIHLHDPGELGVRQIEEICRRTLSTGMHGRVAISHAYALGDIGPDALARVADRLAQAGVSIMTNAPGDRAFPPVSQLSAAGVNVFAGNDNIRDAWWPYGDGDMLERAMMIAYRSGFLLDAELELALDLATGNAAQALGLENYGIAAGKSADFVAIRAASGPEAVVGRPIRQAVYKGGQLVAANGIRV